MSVGSASARTFGSLRRHYNYRLFFAGQGVSVTGTWVQNIAQAWLVIELTHSPMALGILALFQGLPYSVAGLIGGPLVDRLDTRRTIIGTQTAQMLAAAVLAGLAFTHSATVWEVYLLAALTGAVQIVDWPARQAFVYEMVGPSEIPNAVSLNTSLFNAARVTGPAVGGAIIATLGVALCFAINAASFLAVIACLVLMRRGELFAGEPGPQRHMLRSLGEGVSWVMHTPVAWLTCGLMLVVATFGINFSVLLPVMASVTLHSGPVTFGILSACFGGGALAGALFTASAGRPSWRILLGGGAAFAVLLLALAPLHWVAACAVALVLTGAAFTIYTSMSNATVQLAAPDRLRGRAMAVYGYVFIGSAPLGGLLAGWLSAVGGTQLAFLVAGGVCLMAVLVGAGLQRALVPGQATIRPPRQGVSTAGAAGPGVHHPGRVSPSRERTVA